MPFPGAEANEPKPSFSGASEVVPASFGCAEGRGAASSLPARVPGDAGLVGGSGLGLGGAQKMTTPQIRAGFTGELVRLSGSFVPPTGQDKGE